jgi:chromate transporter
VIQALWRLGHTAIRHIGLAVLAGAAIVASLAGVHELLVLAGAAAVMIVAQVHRRQSGQRLSLWIGAIGSTFASSSAVAYTSAVAATVSLWGLFFVFAKAGAVLFGSGYVLLAFLSADLVDRLHWLTEAQLLDAIAVGQVTPGPVFTTATFVGYLLGGFTGAIVATVGIFLPAFVFVAISGPLVPRIRRSPIAGAMLDGVNVASLALMAVVLWHLSRAAFVDWASVAIGVASLAALTMGINSVWLIVAAASVGWWTA